MAETYVSSYFDISKECTKHAATCILCGNTVNIEFRVLPWLRGLYPLKCGGAAAVYFINWSERSSNTNSFTPKEKEIIGDEPKVIYKPDKLTTAYLDKRSVICPFCIGDDIKAV